MIYIVHGDDTPKSRALIVNQQNKLGVQTKTEVGISSASPSQLLDIVSSGSLFGELPFVVFDISDAGRKNVDDYVEIFKKIPQKSTLIVYSTRSLSNANAFIKAAPALGAKVIKNDKVPDSDIFKFLDALGEKNRKLAYRELSRLENEGKDEIYILTMLQYLIRNLAYISLDSPMAKSMNPYIKNKMAGHAKNFSGNEIVEIYDTLYLLEKQVKTGETDQSVVITMAVENVLNSK